MSGSQDLVRRILWLPHKDGEGVFSYYDRTPVYPSHIGRGVGGSRVRTRLPGPNEWEECALFRSAEGKPYFAYPAGNEGDDIVHFPGITEVMVIVWQQDDRQNWYSDFQPIGGMYCRIYPGGNDHLNRWTPRPSTVGLWETPPNIDQPIQCWVRWMIQDDNRILGSAYPAQVDSKPFLLPEVITTECRNVTIRMIGGEYVLTTTSGIEMGLRREGDKLLIILPVPTP